jgi:hypothetical protein
MPFNDLVGDVNASCLSAFGEDFLFTPAATLEEPDPADQAITGILEPGAELEDSVPGDGSVYARLWIEADALDPAPAAGDEISSTTTVYKIVRIQEDAGGGMWLLLRRDRDVT